MQGKTRTNQGGSVVNFLIVGVIFFAVAGVAIFFAQQRGKDIASEPSSPVTVSPSPSPSVKAPSSSPNPRPSQSPVPTPSPAVVPQTGVMPETGPSDILGVVMPVIFLSLSTMSYVLSRRATS